MIRVEGVWKSFAGVAALRGVSFALGGGDAMLLTGASGAGKTTLLRMLFADEQPERGEVAVAGRTLCRLSRASIPYVRRNIGVVFQDFRLIGEATALDNVAVALEVIGTPQRERRDAARLALGSVGLAARTRTRACALSGGEQQRVALARALVTQPSILLCDEPTGNLDPVQALEVLELLEGAHRRGATLLVATHDPAVIEFGAAAGWRRARLVDGELFERDLPAARAAPLDEETCAFTTGIDPALHVQIDLQPPERERDRERERDPERDQDFDIDATEVVRLPLREVRRVG